MDAAAFQRYLEQPTALYELPQEQLRELVDQYPYSANLRLLLLLKARLEAHPEEAVYLARAAAATFDRARLYDLLRELSLDPAGEATEILELHNLDELALEEAALPREAIVETPVSDRGPRYEERLPEPEDGAYDAFTDVPAPPTDSRAIIVNHPPATVVDLDRWAAAAAAFQLALPAPPYHPTLHPRSAPAPPEPTARFQSNSGGEQPSLGDRLRSIRNLQARKLADEQAEVRRIARRSLISQEGTASETLARLLVQQGQYRNAIKMYRRLELLYPEKKAIFAGLIQDLQRKL